MEEFFVGRKVRCHRGRLWKSFGVKSEGIGVRGIPSLRQAQGRLFRKNRERTGHARSGRTAIAKLTTSLTE